MAGHMGAAKVTVRNLEVIDSHPARGVIMVKGSVPGADNSLVRIRLVRKQARPRRVAERKVEEPVAEEPPAKETVVEEAAVEEPAAEAAPAMGRLCAVEPPNTTEEERGMGRAATVLAVVLVRPCRFARQAAVSTGARGASGTASTPMPWTVRLRSITAQAAMLAAISWPSSSARMSR